jgi:hypothetical protein
MYVVMKIQMWMGRVRSRHSTKENHELTMINKRGRKKQKIYKIMNKKKPERAKWQNKFFIHKYL